jgi:hypothetical protein
VCVGVCCVCVCVCVCFVCAQKQEDMKLAQALQQQLNMVQEETRVKAAGDDFARSIASLQARQDLPAIVRGMAAHADHAGVQEHGCRALVNLALNVNNQVAIAAQGGIAAVVAAMRAHTGHADVQEQGCGALRNLASNNADNKVAIAAQGGIAAVVAAMRAHTGHAGVQEYGCRALNNLAANADNKSTIKREGSQEVVQRAMAASNATENTKKWGQALLDKL